ncbi:MAG: hypothetical protein A2X58_06635 [Nitrospirae bacterium GWC2_56_14]|nr:MAG: hypothetical protein A2X58_06635 [Nitrospirae bacterium GWC2_56_14]
MINPKEVIAGFFIAGFLLITSCADSEIGQPVAFQTVDQDSVFVSGMTVTAGIYVVRTPTEWSDFWSAVKASYYPEPPLPPVNFSEKVVIAVVDSVQPTGGYSITITHLLKSATGVEVHAVHQSPGPDCAVTQAIEQPGHIVSTPVFSGEATLIVTETVHNCSTP